MIRHKNFVVRYHDFSSRFVVLKDSVPVGSFHQEPDGNYLVFGKRKAVGTKTKAVTQVLEKAIATREKEIAELKEFQSALSVGGDL